MKMKDEEFIRLVVRDELSKVGRGVSESVENPRANPTSPTFLQPSYSLEPPSAKEQGKMGKKKAAGIGVAIGLIALGLVLFILQARGVL